MAFEALCVNKHDLSRGDDRERERRLRWDLVSGRQTSDDNKEWQIWSKSDIQMQPKDAAANSKKP